MVHLLRVAHQAQWLGLSITRLPEQLCPTEEGGVQLYLGAVSVCAVSGTWGWKSRAMALVLLELTSASCGFCCLGYGKAPHSLGVRSSKQNTLLIQHVETFLIFSPLVQFPDTYLYSCPYGSCPYLTNPNVCVVFR